LFLPYTVEDLRAHFVDFDVDGEDPERHLKKWQKRLADAMPGVLQRQTRTDFALDLVTSSI
jgi:hypothetical protein